LICIFLLLSVLTEAQESTSKVLYETASGGSVIDTIKRNNARKWLVGGGTAIIYGTSFIYLNEAWYKDYPRSSFHSFNDFGEWMQMDKIGHAWTAYTASRISSAMWQWAGVNKNTAVLLGSGTSLLYMLSIEYLDGRSAEWGWSWGDVGADIFGAGLFAAQEKLWSEQRLQLKFSSHRINYEPDLTPRVDNLFGKSLPERLLKDYNAQTYWMSFNINSFLKIEHFPSWLNLSIGYGANGMLGGRENLVRDENGNTTFDRRDIQRYRQLYLAPDIDLTKIKTRSKFLHAVFGALNSFKFPAPTLEFSNNKVKLHGLSF
jgi:hypothetical protein